MLRGERPQPLHAGEGGEGGDFCYAPDAGRTIALLVTLPLRHDTHNVGTGRPFTNRELVTALQSAIPGRRLDLLPGGQIGPCLGIPASVETPASRPPTTSPRRWPTASGGVPSIRAVRSCGKIH